MVADMVAGFSGKQLVLTHTNAGVDAIQKRLSKRKVDTHKYTILTIAAFCNRWGYSYHWTSRMDATLSPFKKKIRNNIMLSYIQEHWNYLNIRGLAKYSHLRIKE